MLLSAIADARIPTTDVPSLAHVCTSPLDAFSDCLLLWLQVDRSSLGINRQINCVEYLFVRQAGFPSCIECEANYFEGLSLLSRHAHLQWLGETSIGRPGNQGNANIGG
jgi:hypothetical protein